MVAKDAQHTKDSFFESDCSEENGCSRLDEGTAASPPPAAESPQFDPDASVQLWLIGPSLSPPGSAWSARSGNPVVPLVAAIEPTALAPSEAKQMNDNGPLHSSMHAAGAEQETCLVEQGDREVHALVESASGIQADVSSEIVFNTVACRFVTELMLDTVDHHLLEARHSTSQSLTASEYFSESGPVVFPTSETDNERLLVAPPELPALPLSCGQDLDLSLLAPLESPSSTPSEAKVPSNESPILAPPESPSPAPSETKVSSDESPLLAPSEEVAAEDPADEDDDQYSIDFEAQDDAEECDFPAERTENPQVLSSQEDFVTEGLPEAPPEDSAHEDELQSPADLLDSKPLDEVDAPAEHIDDDHLSLSQYHHPDYSGRVVYPGIDDLLGDPAFQCRDEWRRKILRAQQEPDEPLTFKPGGNHNLLRHGNVGSPRAPDRPRKAGRCPPRPMVYQPSVPVRVQPQHSATAEMEKTFLPPTTYSKFRHVRPLRECIVPKPRGAPAHEFISQRAKEFANVYQPPPPRRAFGRHGRQSSRDDRCNIGHQLRRTQPPSGLRAPVLPSLTPREQFTSSALQVWCGFTASRRQLA